MNILYNTQCVVIYYGALHLYNTPIINCYKDYRRAVPSHASDLAT